MVQNETLFEEWDKFLENQIAEAKNRIVMQSRFQITQVVLPFLVMRSV